jgi:hypothetical protein
MVFDVKLSSSDLAFISMVMEMYAVQMEQSLKEIKSRNSNAVKLISFVERDIRNAKRLVETL